MHDLSRRYVYSFGIQSHDLIANIDHNAKIAIRLFSSGMFYFNAQAHQIRKHQ